MIGVFVEEIIEKKVQTCDEQNEQEEIFRLDELFPKSHHFKARTFDYALWPLSIAMILMMTLIH